MRQRDEYLAAMGITRWRLRSDGSATAVPAPTDAATSVVAADWAGLEAQVARCRACGLCEGRSQTVFGVGDRRANLLVIGEAPGAEEDRRGEPFVGRAGQLLDQMLAAIGRARGDGVYITNIVKCRPPNNRDPQPQEIASCVPYLQRQLELISPRLILAVGRVAAQTLLASAETIGRLRGKVHRLPGAAPVDGGLPLVVTYHPAYLLRSPGEKKKVWQDLKLVLKELEA